MSRTSDRRDTKSRASRTKRRQEAREFKTARKNKTQNQKARKYESPGMGDVGYDPGSSIG